MNSASNHSFKSVSLTSADFTSASVPLSYLQSGQFLALTAECQGGLIIQKGCYADFVGPGAAVGGYFDTNKCTTIYAAGTIKFHVPQTYIERQQAFQKRIAYIKKLQQITIKQVPLSRANLIMHQLDQWLGVQELKKIPHELIARLVGVNPKTIELLCQHYFAKISENTLATPTHLPVG